eukprot:8696915-Pyramimonas_sp.AAC.1
MDIAQCSHRTNFIPASDKKPNTPTTPCTGYYFVMCFPNHVRSNRTVSTSLTRDRVPCRAQVSLPVVRRFIKRIEERAIGTNVRH